MKKFLTVFFVMLTAVQLLAVSPGMEMTVEAVSRKAICIHPQNETSLKKNSGKYQVILFFDALAPDAGAVLKLIDNLPDAILTGQLRVAAFARNPQQQAKDALSPFLLQLKPENLTIYADNEKSDVFREFCKNEVLLPFAVVIQDGKVRWKGMASDVENVLQQLRTGKFSFQKQLRIDMLRRDLQSAIQAGLPEAILRAADQILLTDPGDTIAIQAKLYVFQGQRRVDLAKAFMLERCEKVKDDVRLRLVLLEILGAAGDRFGFGEAFKSALKDFAKDENAQIRLLGFALENAPLGWIPIQEATAAAEKVCAENTNARYTQRFHTFRLEIHARIAYLGLDIDKAVALQEKAVAAGYGNKAMLDYYRSVKALQKKSK